MIHLEMITPDNWRLGLSVREDQRNYVSDSSGILLRLGRMGAAGQGRETAPAETA